MEAYMWEAALGRWRLMASPPCAGYQQILPSLPGSVCRDVCSWPVSDRRLRARTQETPRGGHRPLAVTGTTQKSVRCSQVSGRRDPGHRSWRGYSKDPTPQIGRR